MIEIKVNDCIGIQDFLEMYGSYIDNQDFYLSGRKPLVTMSEQGWPCFHYLDTTSINSSESEIVVIDCITEGIHAKKYFDQYRTDHKYLIFSNGWWNRDHYQFSYDYEVVDFPYFLLDMANTYQNPYKFCYYSEKTYDFVYPKPAVFVSTIGTKRPERTHVVERLKSQLSYSNYILRYSGEDHGMPCHNDVVELVPGQFDPYSALVEKHYHNLSQSLPIKMYNLACFNLVVETDIDYQEEFFLTEKTVKALISGMPFVSVSTPYFLHHLKKLGFETYHTVWDETYDTVIDYHDRIDSIVRLCEHLKTFDWKTNRESLMNIAMRNRENFFRLNRVVAGMFDRFENSVLHLTNKSNPATITIS